MLLFFAPGSEIIIAGLMTALFCGVAGPSGALGL